MALTIDIEIIKIIKVPFEDFWLFGCWLPGALFTMAIVSAVALLAGRSASQSRIASAS